MSDSNKAAVRRFFAEGVTQGRLDVVDELVSPDFIWHGPGGRVITGAAGLKELVGTYRRAFPNLTVAIEEQVAEGDRVATRFTASGTHDGELDGVAPTGREVTIAALNTCRLDRGRFAEVWEVFDEMAMMQQIGAVPATTQA